jgi:hypothetical protein
LRRLFRWLYNSTFRIDAGADARLAAASCTSVRQAFMPVPYLEESI